MNFWMLMVVLVGMNGISLVKSTPLKTLEGGGGESLEYVEVGQSLVYVGAVLEYEAYNEWTENGGQGIILENARIISEYTVRAKKQGADILVVPEYGLQGLEMHVLQPNDFFSLTQYVPDPDQGTVPCTIATDPANIEALRTLSCVAKENQIYLVVDLAETSPCTPETAADNPFSNSIDASHDCPSSGNIFYNTQVVFDRNGTVIARYRKKNLFLEWQFTPGTEADTTAIFTTDFGVTFSLQVCFDIAYFHPAVSNVVERGIRDIVMSTAWRDELPFHTAPAAQNGWSRGLGVNLLVAGYHKPEKGKMGSGVYRGLTDLKNDYIFDAESGSQLIVAEVETIASVSGYQRAVSQAEKEIEKNVVNSKTRAQEAEEPRRNHLYFYDDLSNYTQVVLVNGDSDVPQFAEACHDDNFCCSLVYSPTGDLTYSLVAYSGTVVKFDEYKIYAQVCSILWCGSEDITSCGRVEDVAPPSDKLEPFILKASNVATEFVYPTVFRRDMALLENEVYRAVFGSEGQEYFLSTTTPTSDIMTAGFYGRWYERDP